jgi:hypothetical protein
MRNGRVRSQPIGGRVALVTKQARAYRANTRKPKRKPKGKLHFDRPLVFDIRIASDAECIMEFDLMSKLVPDQSDEHIFLLPLENINYRADLALAIMERI